MRDPCNPLLQMIDSFLVQSQPLLGLIFVVAEWERVTSDVPWSFKVLSLPFHMTFVSIHFL